MGVPVIFVDAVGPLGAERWEGLTGRLFNSEIFRYAGHSTVAAAGGEILAQPGPEEGVIVADIAPDPSPQSAVPASGLRRKAAPGQPDPASRAAAGGHRVGEAEVLA